MTADVIALGARRRGAWRAAVGGVLRDWRTAQGLRLSDVAARAGVSVQYLSEVERGRKEPSSEILGAVTEALGATLADLALGVADGLTATGDAAATRDVAAREVATRDVATPQAATLLAA